MNIIIDDFVKDLFREDDLGVVIRAHIHMEALLAEYLEILIPFPKALRRINLDFDGRLNLAIAMGLDEEFGKPFRSLGSLRNRFAHNLSAVLDAGTAKNLYSALRALEKDAVQQSFTRLKKENAALEEVEKFSDLPALDQFRLIVVALRAVLLATLITMRHSNGNSPT